MLKIGKRLILSILILLNLSYAKDEEHCKPKCIKVSCASTVQNAYNWARNQISKSYSKLNTAMDEMEKQYTLYHKELDKQNELLTVISELTKDNNIKEKEILFLMKANNGILDTVIIKEFEELRK